MGMGRTLGTVKAYYDARAPEYDDWFHGIGRYADRDRPGWDEDLAATIRTIGGLAPARTLDVACGTAFLSRHLQGELTLLDQSARMLAIAGERVPHAELVQADAIPLPFADTSFERLFTGHFYGHLEEPERMRFLEEARRVAEELVLVDTSLAHSPVEVEWQQRILNDGSEWQVYKRFFSGHELADELGGGQVLHEGRWFVVVRAPA
jgi:demethylmenaquinone methyltransferase/2-methoxy-6-polyprenyl-1,4-benzoquinol methylase